MLLEDGPPRPLRCEPRGPASVQHSLHVARECQPTASQPLRLPCSTGPLSLATAVRVQMLSESQECRQFMTARQELSLFHLFQMPSRALTELSPSSVSVPAPACIRQAGAPRLSGRLVGDLWSRGGLRRKESMVFGPLTSLRERLWRNRRDPRSPVAFEVERLSVSFRPSPSFARHSL